MLPPFINNLSDIEKSTASGVVANTAGLIAGCNCGSGANTVGSMLGCWFISFSFPFKTIGFFLSKNSIFFSIPHAYGSKSSPSL